MSIEFEFTAALIEEFFSITHIQQTLVTIAEKPIKGWEVWLQIEFACFLQKLGNIDWDREKLIEFDQRYKDTKAFLRADFILRKKGWKQESYIAIEFKQHKYAKNCITNMQKDMWRVERMKSSSVDLRSYWVIGIFLKDEELKNNDIHNLIYEALDLHDYKYNPRYTVLNPIPNTNFQYCIF